MFVQGACLKFHNLKYWIYFCKQYLIGKGRFRSAISYQTHFMKIVQCDSFCRGGSHIYIVWNVLGLGPGLLLLNTDSLVSYLFSANDERTSKVMSRFVVRFLVISLTMYYRAYKIPNNCDRCVLG